MLLSGHDGCSEPQRVDNTGSKIPSPQARGGCRILGVPLPSGLTLQCTRQAGWRKRMCTGFLPLFETMSTVWHGVLTCGSAFLPVRPEVQGDRGMRHPPMEKSKDCEIYLRYRRLHLGCLRVSHSRSSSLSLWTPPSRTRCVRVFLPTRARHKSR